MLIISYFELFCPFTDVGKTYRRKEEGVVWAAAWTGNFLSGAKTQQPRPPLTWVDVGWKSTIYPPLSSTDGHSQVRVTALSHPGGQRADARLPDFGNLSSKAPPGGQEIQNCLSNFAPLWTSELGDGNVLCKTPKNLIWEEQVADLADLHWRLIQIQSVIWYLLSYLKFPQKTQSKVSNGII